MARQSTPSSTNGHIPSPAYAQDTTSTARSTRSTSAKCEESPPHFDWKSEAHSKSLKSLPYDPSLLPNGSRSLSAIGLQAFWLGFSLASCLCATVWLALNEYHIWRLPAFFGCLCLFHFLEFYTTASFNVPAVRSDSFLLFNNGTAYNVAHSMAALEIIISNFFSTYRAFMVNKCSIAAGLIMVFTGQLVRSMAMAHAGTNFNHTPAKTRKEGHELVTSGVYRWSRHPSYFGFFWWALGTQMLIGNKVCLFGYAIALWRFFYYRIIAEERTLIDFFGTDYEIYRKRTTTLIPFIR